MMRGEDFFRQRINAYAMGILSMLKEALSGGLTREKRAPIEAKCPKCKEKLTTDMVRCPGCGTHVSSMFRIECPNCKEKNDVSAAACAKCGMSFVPKKEEEYRPPSYICPLCGYKANYYMLQCPSCGVKFI